MATRNGPVPFGLFATAGWTIMQLGQTLCDRTLSGANIHKGGTFHRLQHDVHAWAAAAGGANSTGGRGVMGGALRGGAASSFGFDSDTVSEEPASPAGPSLSCCKARGWRAACVTVTAAETVRDVCSAFAADAGAALVLAATAACMRTAGAALCGASSRSCVANSWAIRCRDRRGCEANPSSAGPRWPPPLSSAAPQHGAGLQCATTTRRTSGHGLRRRQDEHCAGHHSQHRHAISDGEGHASAIAVCGTTGDDSRRQARGSASRKRGRSMPSV